MASQPCEGDGRLFRTWCFWYLIPDRYQIRENWNDFLHVLHTFDTIDDLWATLNSVGRAAQLPKGSRFYIFRKGVQPLWEDRTNVGGRLISIEHQIQNAKKPKISDRWTDVVLGVVGESIANSEMINGVEFTVRKETYNIALWTAPIADPLVDEIAKDFQRFVAWKSPIKIQKIGPGPSK
jgi:translation initiation factor 4E